jgi:hypothetical protein
VRVTTAVEYSCSRSASSSARLNSRRQESATFSIADSANEVSLGLHHPQLKSRTGSDSTWHKVVLKDVAVLGQQDIAQEDVHAVKATVVATADYTFGNFFRRKVAISERLFAGKQLEGIVILDGCDALVLTLLKHLIQKD